MSGTARPWNTVSISNSALTGGEYFIASQTGAAGAPIYRYPASSISTLVSSANWVPPGQPNGVTDNTAALQAAINAAAGKGSVTVPGSASSYIIGTITLPSDTRLVIEEGATLFLKSGTNADMLVIANAAANVLIEHYGTLDGNASGQTTSTSGGITGGIIGGTSSNVFVRGNRQGTITNFRNWPVNITSCTNGEVSGVIMKDSGNSCEFAGISKTITTIASGTYNNSTGAVSITTVGAHGIAVGDEFSIISPTGTGTFALLGGAQFATAGTSGTTLNYSIVSGLGAGTLTGGNVRTCTKCENVGFSDCVVSNIHDLSICLYGGVVNGFIRGCETSGGTSTGPSLLSDTAQSGINIGCEISDNIAHDHLSFAGITVTNNITGQMPLNTRVFNNYCYGNKGGAWIGAADGLDFYGNRLVKNLLGNIPSGGSTTGELVLSAPALRLRVWGNTIRDAQLGATTGYGISLNGPKFCFISQNFIGDYQASPTMAACIGGTWGQNGVSEGNYYGPRVGGSSTVADASTYTNSVQGISYDEALSTSPGSVIFTGQMNLRASLGGVTAFSAVGFTAGWNHSGGNGEVDFMVGKGAGTAGGFDFLQVVTGGTIDTTKGVSGSLLANDGSGNLRLGGALTHGSTFRAGLANAGTYTIPPNTDFVWVDNAASIATGTVLLPTPSAGSYQVAGAAWGELEILFSNPVGTLTVTAPGTYAVSNAPSSIAAANNSIKFIQVGTTWVRRIMV